MRSLKFLILKFYFSKVKKKKTSPSWTLEKINNKKKLIKSKFHITHSFLMNYYYYFINVYLFFFFLIFLLKLNNNNNKPHKKHSIANANTQYIKIFF